MASNPAIGWKTCHRVSRSVSTPLVLEGSALHVYGVIASRESVIEMRMASSFATLVFVVIVVVGGGIAYGFYRPAMPMISSCIGAGAFAIAVVASLSIRVADQWDKAVILRLGKFHSLKGPGLFFIIPVIDAIPYWIDTRVITTGFKAEKTLTKDTVPVDVDAVLFWKVIDPQKAALGVADYQAAISWASQTALRDVIGKTQLSEMLEGRDKISGELQKIIDQRTEPWGINVISVEVKDVLIPESLEKAMSMQAQAERERQARVILGDSERQVAEKFAEAAKSYQHNPVAFHLRAMNMLYEGLKENATIVIVPSTAVESMQLGGLAGLTALTMGIGQDGAKETAKIAENPATNGEHGETALLR
jgi:regulator of protease activity HflC (stomatin/prohibitin superfamily)